MKKMARYVELSRKFSKSERDVFTEEELKGGVLVSDSGTFTVSGGMGTAMGSGTITMSDVSNHIALQVNGTLIVGDREIYIDKSGNVKSRNPKKPLTRGEMFELNTMVKAKERATLLDEYDEYRKLRTSLNKYFDGANDLINE